MILCRSVSLTQCIVTHTMSADSESEIESESGDIDQGGRENTPATQTRFLLRLLDQLLAPL